MEAQVGHIVISLLFFTFGEVKIKKLKTKMEKWKIKRNHYVAPLVLRRLREPSAEEAGLTLPVFPRKLLNTDMPCDWPSDVAHTVWVCVGVFWKYSHLPL